MITHDFFCTPMLCANMFCTAQHLRRDAFTRRLADIFARTLLHRRFHTDEGFNFYTQRPLHRIVWRQTPCKTISGTIRNIISFRCNYIKHDRHQPNTYVQQKPIVEYINENDGTKQAPQSRIRPPTSFEQTCRMIFWHLRMFSNPKPLNK